MSKDLYIQFLNDSIFFVNGTVDEKFLKKDIIKIIPNFTSNDLFEYIYQNYNNLHKNLFIIDSINNDVITKLMYNKDIKYNKEYYLDIYNGKYGIIGKKPLNNYLNIKDIWINKLRFNIPTNNIYYYSNLYLVKREDIYKNSKEFYNYYLNIFKGNTINNHILNIILHEIFKI